MSDLGSASSRIFSFPLAYTHKAVHICKLNRRNSCGSNKFLDQRMKADFLNAILIAGMCYDWEMTVYDL